ncbi:MAG: VanZ family protein [Gammaproteobacteria bacterium]
MDHIVIYLARAALVLMLLAGVYLAAIEGGPVAASNINDKIVHLGAFFVLALFADYAFPHSRFGWFKVLPLLGYGLLIEIMQFYVPYRSFSLADLAADAAGLSLYAATVFVLRQVATPRGRKLLKGQ